MLKFLSFGHVLNRRSGQKSNTVFAPFRPSGHLARQKRAQTHPQCWWMSKKGSAWLQRSYLKRSRSRSGRRRSLKIKVASMQGDTCFLDHFARGYRFDSDGHLALWRHPTCPSMEVRSRSGQLRTNFDFFHIKHIFPAQSFLGIPNMPLFLSMITRTPNMKVKMASCVSCKKKICKNVKNRDVIWSWAFV